METVGLNAGDIPRLDVLLWLQTSRELNIFKNVNKRLKQRQSDWSEVRLTGSGCKACLITWKKHTIIADWSPTYHQVAKQTSRQENSLFSAHVEQKAVRVHRRGSLLCDISLSQQDVRPPPHTCGWTNCSSGGLRLHQDCQRHATRRSQPLCWLFECVTEEDI